MKNVMKWNISLAGLTLLVFLSLLSSTQATSVHPKKTLRFSGLDWIVTPGVKTPDDNHLDSRNAWVDEQGYLHMILMPRNGHWVGSELKTAKMFGYGNYRFWVGGHIDSLDENVQFRMTNRIEAVQKQTSSDFAIAFSRPDAELDGLLQYSVCTADGCKKSSFPFDLKNDRSTHRLSWTPQNAMFLSQDGWLYKPEGQVASWTALNQASKTPAHPITLRLQTSQGKPPINGKSVEIIFRSFCYHPSLKKVTTTTCLR